MARLTLPQTQKILTNVAVVRYQDKKQRFEIACYKNKVMDWRSGVEKNIDEVLQIERVFTNVSKGKVAAKSDLEAVFATDNEKEVCRIILETGQLQVSGKERTQQLENKFREIATIICDKCVNEETQRPFPLDVIETSMREELHFSVNLNKSSKSQALQVIKEMQAAKVLPIQRGFMRLKVTIPDKKVGSKIKPEIAHLCIAVEKETFGTCHVMTLLMDPGNFGTLSELIAKHTKGKGSVEVAELAVQQLGDTELI